MLSCGEERSGHWHQQGERKAGWTGSWWWRVVPRESHTQLTAMEVRATGSNNGRCLLHGLSNNVSPSPRQLNRWPCFINIVWSTSRDGWLERRLISQSMTSTIFLSKTWATSALLLSNVSPADHRLPTTNHKEIKHCQFFGTISPAMCKLVIVAAGDGDPGNNGAVMYERKHPPKQAFRAFTSFFTTRFTILVSTMADRATREIRQPVWLAEILNPVAMATRHV